MKDLRGVTRARTFGRLGALWGYSPAPMPQQQQQLLLQQQQQQKGQQQQSSTWLSASGRRMGISSGGNSSNPPSNARSSSSKNSSSTNDITTSSSSSSTSCSSRSSQGSEGDPLLVEERRGPRGAPSVFTVSLNRPERLNALSLPLLQQLQQLLLSLERNGETNALVILRGEGDKIFSAGELSVHLKPRINPKPKALVLAFCAYCPSINSC